MIPRIPYSQPTTPNAPSAPPANDPAGILWPAHSALPPDVEDLTAHWRQAGLPLPDNMLVGAARGTESHRRLMAFVDIVTRPGLLAAGWRPLHLAAGARQGQLLDILLQAGADIHERNGSGCTPLHLATRYQQHRNITRLLEAGAHPNARDDSGQSALHLATRDNHHEIAHTLIRFGADPYLADNAGKCPIELANEALAAHIALTVSSGEYATPAAQVAPRYPGSPPHPPRGGSDTPPSPTRAEASQACIERFNRYVERGKFPGEPRSAPVRARAFDRLLLQGRDKYAFLGALELAARGNLESTPTTLSTHTNDTSWGHRLARLGKDVPPEGWGISLAERVATLDHANMINRPGGIQTTPHWAAFKAGNRDTLHALVDHDPAAATDLLLEAHEYGHPDFCEALMEAGARP